MRGLVVSGSCYTRSMNAAQVAGVAVPDRQGGAVHHLGGGLAGLEAPENGHRVTCFYMDKPRAFGPSAPVPWAARIGPGRAGRAHRAGGDRLRLGRSARNAQTVRRPPVSPGADVWAFSTCPRGENGRKGLVSSQAIQERRNSISLGIGQPVAALSTARLPLPFSVCSLTVGGWSLEQVGSAPVVLVPHGAPVSSDALGGVSSDAWTGVQWCRESLPRTPTLAVPRRYPCEPL